VSESRARPNPTVTSPIKRFEGLVAICDFVDPRGNTFGLYQVLFEGEPPVTEGFGVTSERRSKRKSHPLPMR
jgi:hypothetical protein